MEKYKISLKEHLSDNKKQVKEDLEKMRELSNKGIQGDLDVDIESLHFITYMVGIGTRLEEFLDYNEVPLVMDNLDYFKKCRKKGLSPYKSLLFFKDYLGGDYEI